MKLEGIQSICPARVKKRRSIERKFNSTALISFVRYQYSIPRSDCLFEYRSLLLLYSSLPSFVPKHEIKKLLKLPHKFYDKIQKIILNLFQNKLNQVQIKEEEEVDYYLKREWKVLD